MKNKNWTLEEDKILKENFKTHSLKELVTMLPGRNYNGVKGRQTFLKICPIYKKDNTFFNIPNTLNSSVAGVLASDGHISPRKGNRAARICLGLNTKDRKLIEYINFYLKSNYKICDTVKEVKFGKYKYIDYKSTLCISTADILTCDLFKHWNIPAGAKSLVLKQPNITDLNVCLAYIKGLIIGDGSIIITSEKRNPKNIINYCRVLLLGTEPLLVWVKDIFEKFLNEKINSCILKEYRDKKVFHFSISGIKASRIIHKLNSLDCINLDRKFKQPEILKIIKQDIEKYPQLFV